MTILLIGSNLAVITFRGLKSLPECFFTRETRFAIGLSLKSACISTSLCFLLVISALSLGLVNTVNRMDRKGRRYE